MAPYKRSDPKRLARERMEIREDIERREAVDDERASTKQERLDRMSPPAGRVYRPQRMRRRRPTIGIVTGFGGGNNTA